VPARDVRAAARKSVTDGVRTAGSCGSSDERAGQTEHHQRHSVPPPSDLHVMRRVISGTSSRARHLGHVIYHDQNAPVSGSKRRLSRYTSASSHDTDYRIVFRDPKLHCSFLECSWRTDKVCPMRRLIFSVALTLVAVLAQTKEYGHYDIRNIFSLSTVASNLRSSRTGRRFRSTIASCFLGARYRIRAHSLVGHRARCETRKGPLEEFEHAHVAEALPG
jgi:hypothetical protein